MRTVRIAVGAAVAVMAFPAASMAATTSDTSPLTGSVGTELTLSVTDAAALSPAFTHSAASTTSSAVEVTSTSATWTLSIKDAAIANAGHVTKDGLGDVPLANALQWNRDGGAFADLSATDATVKTSASSDTMTVGFSQTLGSAEDVVAGDAYSLDATYTLVG
jgi:hypothetical protein